MEPARSGRAARGGADRGRHGRGDGGGVRAGGASTIGAVLCSGAWTVQAAILLALGWARSSAFLRWMGLSLFGLTVVKFLTVDLQQVEVFWRFLTAIVVGAVLLAVSYLYQRRRRAAEESPAP